MGTLLMKMAVFLQGHAFCAWTAMDPSGYFFFEKPSLIDFQIGTGRKREFRAAELRFSLHKEFCAAEIRFYLYKEYVGAILKKIVILLKENWSHMDNFKGAMLMKIVILLKENWSHMDKFSIYFKIFRDANSWGAMRQEMAIFKGGNSVCRVQMFFRSFHFIFRKK